MRGAAEATRELAGFSEWWGELTHDDGERHELEGYQAEVAADLCMGWPVVWAVLPEGNTKTTFAAAFALHHIEHGRRRYVAVAASARDQAEWLWRQAEGLALASGREDDYVCLEGYRRIRYDATDSRIQVFSADDRSGDGAIATLYIIDELHRHRDLSLYRTWLGKVRKRAGSQLLVISTAGEEGSEFEQERQRFRHTGKQRRSGAHTRAELPQAVLHDWALREEASPEDMEAVKEANPFSGITAANLAEKRAMPGMTQQHWMRFSCNRAQRSQQAAITEQEWWGARSAEAIPEGEPCPAGLDLGWKRDTTALVRCWSPRRELRRLSPATVLVPPDDGQQLDAHLVERALQESHRRNPITLLVMDMTNGAQLSQWAQAELGCEVVDRTQSDSLAAVDYAFFMEALREGWLEHAGDVAMAEHALNAIAQELPSGKTRFQRPKESRSVRGELRRRRVIDALSAATFAHTQIAAEWGDPPAPELEPMFAFV